MTEYDIIEYVLKHGDQLSEDLRRRYTGLAGLGLAAREQALSELCHQVAQAMNCSIETVQQVIFVHPDVVEGLFPWIES